MGKPNNDELQYMLAYYVNIPSKGKTDFISRDLCADQISEGIQNSEEIEKAVDWRPQNLDMAHWKMEKVNIMMKLSDMDRIEWALQSQLVL